MKLFKKPKWLKPEINELRYWIHIIILAIVVIQIMSWFGYCSVFELLLILKIGLAIVAGDIIAHSLLKLD